MSSNKKKELTQNDIIFQNQIIEHFYINTTKRFALLNRMKQTFHNSIKYICDNNEIVSVEEINKITSIINNTVDQYIQFAHSIFDLSVINYNDVVKYTPTFNKLSYHSYKAFDILHLLIGDSTNGKEPIDLKILYEDMKTLENVTKQYALFGC